MSAGKLPLFVALIVAIAAAIVPWQVCIPTSQGTGMPGVLGHHGHQGHQSHGGHGGCAGHEGDPSAPADCEDEDHDCCVHVSMDVGVRWVATALDAPADAVTAAPPRSAERASVASHEVVARVPCEEDSIVLNR